MPATYTKLRDGSWGIRVQGRAVSDGEAVTVTTKAEESRTETIRKVLWSGNGVSLCSVVSRNGNGGRTRSNRGSRSSGGYRCSTCGHTPDDCADMDCTCRDCGGMMG